MEEVLGGLLEGVAGAVGALLLVRGGAGPGMLAAIAAAVLALWIATRLLRRARRRARLQQAARVASQAQALKDELRSRLAEPRALFPELATAAPTMGASEAFEGDIEAAARTVLVEAGGERAKAKQILRKRVNGGTHLNGSEVAAWRQLGALSLLDSTGDALAAYARAADLAPADAQVQMLAGVLHLRDGNLAAAEAAFRRQLKLGNGAQASLLGYRGRTMLGDVHAARGGHTDALAFYADAQREVLALLDKEPANRALQRDLSVSCDRIGDILAAQGQLDGALESYRRGLEIAEVLAAGDAQSPAWQHDLSVSHDRIGDVLERQGDTPAALESYRKSLAIAEVLAGREPSNAQRQWDLAASLDRIGDSLVAIYTPDEALKCYRRGLAVAEGLARRDPGHMGWQRDLAISCHKVGLLEAARGNAAAARVLLEKGRAIIARLDRIASHQAQWRSDLSEFEKALKGLDA